MIRKHLQGAFGCVFGETGILNYKGVATLTDVFQFGLPKIAFEWFFIG